MSVECRAPCISILISHDSVPSYTLFSSFARLTPLLSSFSFLLRVPAVSPHLRCIVVGRAEAGERKTKIGRQCISGNQFNV